jgi:ABC-type sugar transport system ATPase subunit
VTRPLVEIRGVSKRFGGVQAVDGVSVAIEAAAVHGLVGENGAGKSTLAKIIGGVHEPDEGELLVDGEAVRLRAPRDALAVGIATIAQEIALVPARSVLENVFLGLESRRFGVVDRARLRRRYAELEDRTGFGLDPDARVGGLRTADQQKAEIMRALARDARLILMDEPTASLTADESRRLLDIIAALTASGTAVVLVSHHLEEVLEAARTITVMRDGRVVRTGPADAETQGSLVNAMVGRALELTFPPRRPAPATAPVVLAARGLTRAGAVADVSLTVRAGEIVGLAGLVGSGRSEVARLIFGADRLDAGEIELEGRPVHVRGPGHAARPGDRARAREPQGGGAADGALHPRQRHAGDPAGLRDGRGGARRPRAAPGRGALPPARRARTEHQDARGQPVRRQPAEGPVRQVARGRAQAPHRRRADARHRRGRQAADPRPDRRPRPRRGWACS